MVCATRAVCEPLRRQMVDSNASLCTVSKPCMTKRSNRASATAAAHIPRAQTAHGTPKLQQQMSACAR
eukprot:4697870-Lingulodinium_polyedra.AAC.1